MIHDQGIYLSSRVLKKLSKKPLNGGTQQTRHPFANGRQIHIMRITPRIACSHIHTTSRICGWSSPKYFTRPIIVEMGLLAVRTKRVYAQ